MTIAAAPHTRAEIEEALANMLDRARREFAVVGTREHPTPWDIRHAALDRLVGEWLEAGPSPAAASGPSPA